MKYLPILGCTLALISYADIATGKTAEEIKSIAKTVTVEIKLLNRGDVGSGIIIDRQGDLYTLITNRHVVCGSEQRKCATPPQVTYPLNFSNGKQYKLPSTSVKIFSRDLDLAIVQFRTKNK